MKTLYLLLLALIFTATSTFAQTENRSGGVKYKKRNANGSVEIQPGAATTIKFNDSTTLKYTAGKLTILINGTEKFKASSTGVTVPALTINGSTSTALLAAKVDTGRTVSRVIGIAGAKVGATAGWTVAAGNNISLSTLAASQTSSTLVIPITYALKVGSRITGFSLIGQMQSVGAAVSITADLRKQTAAATGVVDASVGAMAAPLSVTAQTALSSANAVKTGLTETVGPSETFYILITGTSAASTGISIQGIVLNLSE